MRNDPTGNFKKGNVSGQIFDYDGWGMNIKGNIAELLKPDSLVSKSIKEAKQRAAQIKETKDVEIQQINMDVAKKFIWYEKLRDKTP